ncbi:hypothetical protein F2P81_006591 [Scophthalmus maximus]|uniref:Uncharacterized protein n=1 Tax=Scophthalmus maximus TaxID=52904 RepID=A0A6A4T3K5_SCOMX|nr:hypothetical protein F2P81_006591 [Scophthalmus maximus]
MTPITSANNCDSDNSRECNCHLRPKLSFLAKTILFPRVQAMPLFHLSPSSLKPENGTEGHLSALVMLTINFFTAVIRLFTNQKEYNQQMSMQWKTSVFLTASDSLLLLPLLLPPLLCDVHFTKCHSISELPEKKSTYLLLFVFYLQSSS